MRVWVLGMSVLAMPLPASAHEWYNRHRDPVFPQQTCCGGKDCNELPPHAMKWTPEGDLRVVLTLEEAQKINPQRIEPFDAIIPYDRIQWDPEDAKPHICLMAWDRVAEGDKRQGFFCIFLPPNG